MARPPSHGPAAVSSDIADLNRLLHRAEQDTKRSPSEKAELLRHLKGALAVLLLGSRDGDKSARKSG